MSNKIGLGEFITKVKEELKPAEDSPIFFLEKAELEIHVTVSQEGTLEAEAQGKADLKINVLGVNVKLGEAGAGGTASGKLQRQKVHTIKVTLTPILTKEEIKSTLSREELDKIRAESRKKIMRGEKEEEKPSLSEGKPKDEATSNKRMRG
jgi:hypothetical protein